MTANLSAGAAAAGDAVTDSVAEPTATIYTAPDCMQCVATKRAFAKLTGVSYTLVDVSTDREARDMLADMGYRAAPVVITAAGEHWSGFRPDRISALSALSAQAAVASNASRAAPALTPDRRAPAGPAPLDHAARAWAQAMAERMRTGLRSAANTGLSL